MTCPCGESIIRLKPVRSCQKFNSDARNGAAIILKQALGDFAAHADQRKGSSSSSVRITAM